jgi:hypothetical protein
MNLTGLYLLLGVVALLFFAFGFVAGRFIWP